MYHVINIVLMGLNRVGGVFYDYAAGVFIQSALLVILLFAIDLLLRKKVRAIFRYCVWLLVLVKLILPPMLSLPTGIGYWVGDHIPVASNRAFEVVAIEHARPSGEMLLVRPAENFAGHDPTIAPADSTLTALTWQAVLFLLWLAGVLAFLAVLVQRIRFVKGLVAASCPAGDELTGLLEQSRLQMAVRRDIKLRLSEAVPSPAVCGLLRPTVLMPTSLVEKLSPEGLRATLIHELAHIKRGDLWVNSVQTFLQVVYFYNPFVWFANSVIRKVCEEAVDETVLVALGGRAKDYSNTLIDIGEMVFWKADLGLRLIGVAESKKALQWRIRHMLNRPIPKSSKLGALSIAILLVIAAVLLPMARAQKPGEKSETISGENQEESTKSLHQAAADGDIEQVRLLVSNGVDVNSRDARKKTSLHYAAYAGRMDVVQLLIEAGADVNCKDGYGQTPTALAMKDWHDSVVDLLISKGADVTLDTAIYLGDLAKVKSFIESDPDVNETQLNWLLIESLINGGVKQGYKEVAEFLLQKGASPNARDRNNGTILHNLAWGGDFTATKAVIEFMISKGADINAQGNLRWTPLHSALHQRRGSVAKVLIDNGADVTAKDSYGCTVLHYAASNGMKDVVELLISKGADIPSFHRAAWAGDLARVKELVEQGTDINTKDEGGWTALHWVASIGHRVVAEYLIAKGADVNAKAEDSSGTPLHVSARAGNTDMAALLVDKGANINSGAGEDYGTPLETAADHSKEMVEWLLAKGADINTHAGGWSALHSALDSERFDILELLLAKGADVNIKDSRGRTPLHYTARHYNNPKVVELLISKGADINAKNNNGKTALLLAKENGHTEIVELLINHGAKE